MSDVSSDDVNSSNSNDVDPQQAETQAELDQRPETSEPPSPNAIEDESSFDLSVAAENDSRSVSPKPTQDVSDPDATFEDPQSKKTEANSLINEDMDEAVGHEGAEKRGIEERDDEEEDVPVKKRRVEVDSDEEEQDSLKADDAAVKDIDDFNSNTDPSPTKKRVTIDSDEEEEDIADRNEKELHAANSRLFDDGASDDSSDKDNAEQKKELMANIFGDDSDDDDENEKVTEPSSSKAHDDEDEPRFLGRERDDDSDAETNNREWDFDVMMRQKKKENKKRRKRKDGAVDLISDMDDQIKELVEKMQEAANQDRVANAERRPALKKRMMLASVKQTLLKADLCDTLLDNGMMSAVSEWLAPLPDKSLPSLEIRSTLLKILQSYSNLEHGILKQSGLGKAVMLLFKHPRETKDNREMANRLIREWSRPIFQSEVDMRMDKEERTQRDWEHIPQVKRKNMSFEEFQRREGSSKKASAADLPGPEEDPLTVRVGEKGFIGRARVPRPSTRDYIVRPKPKIDQQFREPTKNRSTNRFDRAQREFMDRTRKNKSMRAVSISLEGRKME